MTIVAIGSAAGVAQPASPHHEFLGGPWEVLVKTGLEGDGIRMALSIADENKTQPLDATIPVMGTPIKVRLEQYLPDLKWETTAVDDPNGGPVARLSLRGENLQQDVWLCARDREKQSISARIGSVAIRELPGSPDASLLQELMEPEVVGILLVWPSKTGSPLVYAVKPGKVMTLPGSSWKLSYPDGRNTDTGEIVEAVPPRRLVLRWQHQDKPELKAEGESRCTMELGSSGPVVKLSLTHTIEREPSKFIAAVSGAWPMVLSNLKSLLETGSLVLQNPYSA